MTIEDIQRLITDDEHRELEVKQTTGELKVGMDSACAFLNTDGGWLIFGITPKTLKVLGEQVTDSTRREISEAISGLEPALESAPNTLMSQDVQASSSSLCNLTVGCMASGHTPSTVVHIGVSRAPLG